MMKGVDGNGPKGFSVQRKLAIVARLLRGEPLDLVARQTNVSVARLTEWRDRALTGAATALKENSRSRCERPPARAAAQLPSRRGAQGLNALPRRFERLKSNHENTSAFSAARETRKCVLGLLLPPAALSVKM